MNIDKHYCPPQPPLSQKVFLYFVSNTVYAGITFF